MRLVFVLSLTLVSACSDGAQVIVRNHSPEQLQNVTVSAKGASSTIASIEAGSDWRTTLCPKGEAGSAELTFVAGGRQHREQLPLYFECDFLYRVQFDVSREFDVKATARLR